MTIRLHGYGIIKKVAALSGGEAKLTTGTWQRPDLPPEYGQSAFADLGTAAFLTALAIPLAVAALLPRRPKPQL